MTVKAFILDMKDESRLIHLAKTANSEQAFTALVKHHQGKVRAFLFRLCGSSSLADDIGQETFILAYQKLPSFQGESKFSTWLLAIAYRCFLQSLRKSKRETEKTNRLAKDAEINPGYYESISPAQLDLEFAMKQLSEVERAALTLCFSFGCSHSEASMILKIPLGTLKTNILRGKEKLRVILVETEPK